MATRDVIYFLKLKSSLKILSSFACTIGMQRNKDFLLWHRKCISAISTLDQDHNNSSLKEGAYNLYRKVHLSLPECYNNLTNLLLGKLQNLNLLHHFSLQNPKFFVLLLHKNYSRILASTVNRQ